MPGETGPPPPDSGGYPGGYPGGYTGNDPGSLVRGRFTYFPVAPSRVEFAVEVREAILRDRPEVIAVELPATLQGPWLPPVARLPEISVIVSPDDKAQSDQGVYVPIDPADPFTE